MHRLTWRTGGHALVAVLAITVPLGCGPGPTPTPSPTSPPSPSPSASASIGPSSPSPATPQPTGLADWTRVSPSGEAPVGREGQTWTVDPSSALAYVFGGRGPHELNDLWAYDLSSDAWTKITPAGTLPPARAD